MRSLVSSFVAAVLLSACGGRSADPDAGAEVLTREERDLADRGGESSNATQQLTVLADSLFDFDPTIDPSKTAGENATALDGRVRANLGSADGGVGCGSVSVSGTTVTVTFGPAPGCALQNGAKISGSVSVGVEKSGSTITLTLTLTQVVSNGVPLSGNATFVTTTGSSFTVTANVTSGTTTWVVTDLTATGGTGTATLNGSVTVSGDTASSLTLTSLTWAAAACYPHSGTIASKKGLVTTVITFDANTPITGLVKVTVGRKTSTVPLPSHGQCGSTPDAGP